MYYPKRFVMLNACPPKLKIQNRKLHPRHYGSAPDVVHQLQHARRVSIKSWAGTVPILLNRSIVVTHTACREWMRCHPVHSDTLCLLLLTILFELSIPVLVVLVNLLKQRRDPWHILIRRRDMVPMHFTQHKRGSWSTLPTQAFFILGIKRSHA